MSRLPKPALAAAVAAALLFSAGHVSAQAPATAGCPDEIRHNATRAAAEFVSGSDTIRGYIYRPATSNGAGIVLLHGAQGLPVDAPRFDSHAIQLASRGYWVMLPAYFDADAPAQGRRLVNARAWRCLRSMCSIVACRVEPGP